jgi:hypothetical protein
MPEETITPKAATKTTTVSIEVPAGEDPKAYLAKATKLIEKSRKDSDRRERYNEARNAAHAALIAKHPDEWKAILRAEKIKRGINPND